MAQDPNKPKDDGKIGLPKIDSGMNKLPSKDLAPADDKGSQKPAKTIDPKEADKIIKRGLKRFERCAERESDNRSKGLEDLKFKAGEQWPPDILATRNFDKRPALTINKIPTITHQITNDLRQNRPGIVVSPVGDQGDPDLAKMFRGMIRAIERDSSADIAYDTGIDSAVSNGWGYWRITTEYENPKSFNQIPHCKRVRNPFTVYLDPDHQEPDGADSRYGFVTEMTPRSEFRDSYPDAREVAWDKPGVGDNYKSWVDKDNIRVAEYFEMEHKKRELVQLANGHIGWEDELDDEALKHMEVISRRTSYEPKIHWYKMTCLEILEDREWLGQWIPIVKVIGDEIDIEGKVKYSGVIRNTKDPQRMYNYWAPLSLDTPLPTPTGWTTMGDVKNGDQLIDEQGDRCTVLGKSPVHILRDCYRVTFGDGTYIDADAGHPWQVEERGKRKTATWDWQTKIITTAELTPKKHYIPAVKPIDLPDADLLVPPYLLGVWLGDGSSAEPQITQGAQDIEEMRSILVCLGLSVGHARIYGDRAGVFTVHGVRKAFTQLQLLGNKHIPTIYLRASTAQRWALLQGLMDTDGSAARRTGQCSFTTTSGAIAYGFEELARSLGIIVKLTKRQRAAKLMPGGYVSAHQPAYQYDFTAGDGEQVFRLSRKQDLVTGRPRHWRRNKRHAIVSVSPIPSVPVQCVMVNAPSHLFLAGPGMVPTHNTSETEMIALQPKAPWVMEEGQIEGHESVWKQANTRSYPYLLYKASNVNGVMAPPPQRQPFAGSPTGIVEAKMGAAQDMMATSGVRFDATKSERMMDESGRAIRELRRSGDLGSFHYSDNAARSLRHTGRIYIDLIRKLCDTKRAATILLEDGSEEKIIIDPHAQKACQDVQQSDGTTRRVYNPKLGEYAVTVTIGPNAATKRIEAAESMMDMVKAAPNIAAVVMDLIVKNLDFEGADEMARRIAKTIPPNLMTPSMRGVPPQVQAMMEGLQGQIKQMMQERVAMMKELQDKKQDQAIELQAIDKTFQAKMAAIEEKFTEALMKIDANMQVTAKKTEAEVIKALMGVIQAGHQADAAAAKANSEAKP